MRAGTFRHLAMMSLLLASGAAKDIVVTETNGLDTRVIDAGFYLGPISSPTGSEKRGVVVDKPSAEMVRYAEQATTVAIMGRVTTYYVPWEKIEEIEVLDSKPPDQRRYPAKLKMRDGKIVQANIIVNGASSLVVGKNAEGGDIRIPLSNILKMKPINESRPGALLGPDIPYSQTPGVEKVQSIKGLRYASIPSGTFEMGCSPRDGECFDDEKPPRSVAISKAYWMSQTEVTRAAYLEFESATGAITVFGGHDDYPVQVTWKEASEYCKWAGGRLPTEAEWEYAARGGTQGARYGELDTIAWYSSNSGGVIHPVAQKARNKFGLYDMIGNSWEWCSDWYDPKFYQKHQFRGDDPPGPLDGTEKVIRGGSSNYEAVNLRASFRHHADPNEQVGFRCLIEALPINP